MAAEMTTEEKILLAAEQEFLRKGFAAARTTSIAETAGVTHAMLHYYYRTKDKLFQKVVESKIESIRNLMLGSLDSPGTPLFEKLATAISNHLDFIAANPDLPRFFINEICSCPERMAEVSEIISSNAGKVVELLQQQIDDAVAEGKCRPADARMLLIDILSLNAFPFMAAPLVSLVGGDIMQDREKFLALRKKETLEIIMNKLRP